MLNGIGGQTEGVSWQRGQVPEMSS